MPISPKSKLIPALLGVAALLALPAAANATLAYTTNIFHPHVYRRQERQRRRREADRRRDQPEGLAPTASW